MTVLCVYHRNCADGLVAAWAVHRALGDAVDFHAAAYSDEGWPDVTGRDVLIVDFSYKRDVLEEMAQRARSVLVLDHHKTAAADLAGLPIPPSGWMPWCFAQADPRPSHALRLAALFDLNRSGAGIAWDFMSGGAPRPAIVDLAEDRDLWRFRNAYTKPFHAVLTSYDGADLPARLAQLDVWSDMSSADWCWLIETGRAILRYEDALVTGIVRGTRRAMRIGDHVVPVACVPGQLASDAGHLLCSTAVDRTGDVSFMPLMTDDGRSYPLFSATYYDGADGKRHFSLRSPPGGLDVGSIARIYGGGGHEHAAGFDRPIGWEGEK